MRCPAIRILSVAFVLASELAAAEPDRRSEYLESETALLSTPVKNYAQETGLTLEEARLALAREELAVPQIARLRVEFSDRLAGLFWVRRPAQGIVVRLTGDEAVPRREIQTEAGSVPITFVAGADATTAELAARLNAAGPVLRKTIPDLTGSWIDETSGRIVLDVAAPAARAFDSERAIVEQAIGFPVEFRYVAPPQDLNVPQVRAVPGY